MEVILLKDMEKLGYANDIVNVKPGYANNYLIPQGYAKAATASAKKVLAENLRQRAHKDAKILADAQALAETIANLPLSLAVKAEEGKLFGTVTATDLQRLSQPKASPWTASRSRWTPSRPSASTRLRPVCTRRSRLRSNSRLPQPNKVPESANEKREGDVSPSLFSSCPETPEHLRHDRSGCRAPPPSGDQCGPASGPSAARDFPA